MTRIERPGRRDAALPQSIPLGEIWSKFTSEVGHLLTEATPKPPAPTPAPAPPAPPAVATETTMVTTEVFTTVRRTSFTTVRLTTAVVQTRTGNGPEPTTSDHTTLKPGLSKTSPTLLPSFASSTALSSHDSVIAPTGGRQHQTTLTSPTPLATHTPSANATATGAERSHAHEQQKHAIIGGLSGAIAGLVLIGVLIIFFLRRRRPKESEPEANAEAAGEKGLRPTIARKWTEMTMRNSQIYPAVSTSRGTTTPDIDGGLIRMSLDRWPRPYANGEGYRESLGPRRLQVMNPSPSRPSTPLPRGSSESVTNFLNRQRAALGAVLAGATRSRANSNDEMTQRAVPVPTIAIDPGLSRECVATYAPTPSFRSYPSVSSLPVVEQRPPEDPFLTPPDERAEEGITPTQTRRPGIAPLQSAAGAASRTLSHLGAALNPFRSKSHLTVSTASTTRHSVSTFSSAGDQFQLDRASLRENNDHDANDTDRNIRVYEGT